MSIESRLSGHWTDHQLIEHIYGVGPTDGHLNVCAECQGRVAAMEANRCNRESDLAAYNDVSADFLAAQRRAIYQRITKPVPWWPVVSMRRLAAGFATVAIIGGSVFLYEQNHQVALQNEGIGDAQLAQEVSSMAVDSEAKSTAPIKALFEE